MDDGVDGRGGWRVGAGEARARASWANGADTVGLFVWVICGSPEVPLALEFLAHAPPHHRPSAARRDRGT